jgi:hypothetical protein
VVFKEQGVEKRVGAPTRPMRRRAEGSRLKSFIRRLVSLLMLRLLAFRTLANSSKRSSAAYPRKSCPLAGVISDFCEAGAQNALGAVFAQVESRLPSSSGGGFSCVQKILRNSWPRLEVSYQKWGKVFGDEGTGKIWVQFCIEGVPGAPRDSFSCQILLWHEKQTNWPFIKLRLPRWFEQLRLKGFVWGTELDDRKGYWEIGKAEQLEQLKSIPRYVFAYRAKDEERLQNILRDGRESTVVLTSELVKQVKDLADAITSLR